MDMISRQAAIDAIEEMQMPIMRSEYPEEQFVFKGMSEALHAIKALPSAQPEQHYDEWCTDCKEYNNEKHCCPRWNKVIRQALQDAQPEPCGDAISRTEAMRIASGYCHPANVVKELAKLPSVQPDLDSAYTEGYTQAEAKYRKMWDEMQRQPEIIRCKDCKYGSPNGKYGCKCYHYRLYETHEMKQEDFCSRAERRTDG